MVSGDDEPTEGLQAVFMAERTRLLAFARAIGAADEAEDVLQDAWLRIREARGPIASPLAYLHRVVHSVMVDRRRGRQRSRTRDTHWVAEGAQAPGQDPAHPERILIGRQALDEVQARIDALGEPTATIFRRHRLLDQPQKQVARDMGLALSTIERHLRRAYALLHEIRGGDLEV